MARPPTAAAPAVPADPGPAFDVADAAVRVAAVAVLVLGTSAQAFPGGREALLAVVGWTASDAFGLPPFLAAPAWMAGAGVVLLLGAAVTWAASRLSGRADLAVRAGAWTVDGGARLLGAVAGFLGSVAAAGQVALVGLVAGIPIPSDGPGVGAFLYVPLLAATVWTLAPRYWAADRLDARIRAAGGRVLVLPGGVLAEAGAVLEAIFVLALGGSMVALGLMVAGYGLWLLPALLWGDGDPTTFLPPVRTALVLALAVFAWRRWLWPPLRRTGLFALRRIEAAPDGALRFYGPFAMPLGCLPAGARVSLQKRDVSITRRGGGTGRRRDAVLEARFEQAGRERTLVVDLYRARDGHAPWLDDVSTFLRG